ncbi:MAG TPA: HAD family hydrolase, partial [Candidatus Acidoferrum sp.]
MSTSHHNSNGAPQVPDGSSGINVVAGQSRGVTYWRVEGSLLELGALRPVLFFTWNSRSYAERWARRAGMAGMALVRPFTYAASRTFATRFLHTLLRGVSRDRLDLLGEEYFQYVLKPQMRRDAVDKLVEALRSGERVVLVSQLLDHILKPLAKHFGVESIIANRLDFR